MEIEMRKREQERREFVWYGVFADHNRLKGHGDEHLGQFLGRRVVIVGELENYHWGHGDDSAIQGAIQGVWLRYHGKLPNLELGTIQEYIPPVAVRAQP